MNKFIASAALLAAVVVAAPGCGPKGPPDTGEPVQQIGVEDAPKPIRTGVARDYPGATITRVERVREDGQYSYIVYLDTSNGDRREIRYTGTGRNMGNR